jgi:bifunctional UDP-N-acetylglucosamine pyrophosphorylase/glucosamine-1-phosphate N-acetyltransferase
MTKAKKTDRDVAVVVLAAGKGTRMRSDLPKVLHPVAGVPMVEHVLANVERLRPQRLVVVVAPDGESVAAAVAPWPTAVQPSPLGTGDAVKAAHSALRGFRGDVLIVFGDGPFLSVATLRRVLAKRRRPSRRGGRPPVAAVLGFRPADPARYGRLVVGDDGQLDAIVEFADATAAQRRIGLCNSGVMAVDGRRLFDLLEKIRDKNAKNEFYLTDLVALARAAGRGVAVVEAPEEEFIGIDSRAGLARAEAAMQNRLRQAALDGGATMIAPDTVFLSMDTRLGRDVTIWPHVVFGPGVAVGDRVEIRSFCHIEGASIAADALVGPYARLRPGTRVGRSAHVGNFVELKNTDLGDGAKANHLAYLGDSSIGSKTNIGAGTITCNYDGTTKSRTTVGREVFVGSNATLVAPVSLGDRAYVAAGSTITRDVPADALAFGRARQVEKPGRAAQLRARKKA